LSLTNKGLQKQPVNLINQIMRLIFFLLLIPICSIGQSSIKGKIKDIRGNPLALTNVVSLKNNNGTITNENGEFQLSNILETDTLKITNIAFIPKLIPVSLIHDNYEIFLVDSIKKLDEVIVKNFRVFRNLLNLGYSSSSTRGEFRFVPGNQLAVYINNPYNKNGWIKSVKFGIKDYGKCQNSMRLRLLEVDRITNFPTIDLLTENVILANKILKKKNTIDLSEYKILMPKNGIYIMIEWLDTESNCDKNSYTSISANLETPTDAVWLNYRDKKWKHTNRPRLPNGNFMTPNFGIDVAF
jgi:hypothetical protein